MGTPHLRCPKRKDFRTHTPHPTKDQKSPPETRKSPAGSRTFHANSHFTASCPAPPHPLNTLNVPTSAPLSVSSTTQPTPAFPAKVTLFSAPGLQSPALPSIAQGHPLPCFHPSKAFASFPSGENWNPRPGDDGMCLGVSCRGGGGRPGTSRYSFIPCLLNK